MRPDGALEKSGAGHLGRRPRLKIFWPFRPLNACGWWASCVRLSPSMKPHHLAIKVKNLKLCGDFYSKILGLKKIKNQFDEKKNIRAIWFKMGSMILMLEKSEEKSVGASNTGLYLLALTIKKSERAKWKAKLKKAGVAITSESPFTLYFSDPEGNRLGLSHYPKK